MHSSTSNFDFTRVVPDVPWRGVLLAVGLLSVIATAASSKVRQGWAGIGR